MIWEEFRPSSKLQEFDEAILITYYNSRLEGEGKTT